VTRADFNELMSLDNENNYATARYSDICKRIHKAK